MQESKEELPLKDKLVREELKGWPALGGGGGRGDSMLMSVSANSVFCTCVPTHTQLAATELVVNDSGEIREANRVPGENEVS